MHTLSVQHKGWKLVGHLIKIGTLLELSLAFPLEMYSKICPTKLDFAQSYAEVGRKMTIILSSACFSIFLMCNTGIIQSTIDNVRNRQTNETHPLTSSKHVSASLVLLAHAIIRINVMMQPMYIT